MLAVLPQLIKRTSEPLARSIEESENSYTQLLEGATHGVTEAAIYGYLDENIASANMLERDLHTRESKLLYQSWRLSSLTNTFIAISVVGFSWLAQSLTRSESIPAVQVTMLIFIPLVIFEAITAWYPNLFGAGKLLMSQRSVDNLLATSNDIEVGQKIESEISRVTAENLTVSWGESFMQPVSFDLSKGEILVVRGRSGSGKSTLAMGLLGLLPYEGSLTFDGNDADGFSDLNSRIVGTVQRSHIFNTSLRENLKIANQEATDTELIQVLTILELDQLLNELAEGLDTVIGDFGRVISGGEAKRLSVARVLLAKADVYILDEPTEHLDDALAGRIEKAIAKRLREKITIVITHTGWEGFDKTLTMRR